MGSSPTRHPLIKKTKNQMILGLFSFMFLCGTRTGRRRVSTVSDQPGATATTAACGRNKEELLGQRPAGCETLPRAEAAAGSRNPSLSLSPRVLDHQECLPWPHVGCLVGLEQGGPASGGVTNSPVGCLLVRGSWTIRNVYRGPTLDALWDSNSTAPRFSASTVPKRPQPQHRSPHFCAAAGFFQLLSCFIISPTSLLL